MRIGILGGGQLARMLALAGHPLGLQCVFLESAPEACAAPVGRLVTGAFKAEAALADFAAAIDVVTTELEHVPLAALEYLAQRRPLLPGSRAIALAQDRLLEKDLFRRLQLPTAHCVAVDTLEELVCAMAETGLPAVLKTRHMGYDGKGQVVLRETADAAAAWRAVGGVPCLLEAMVPFDREVSVIAVRSREGECRFWPLTENRHRNGILSVSRALLQDPLQMLAEDYCRRLLEALDYVGVLALELFQVGDSLLANEYAPRVHNSGHWTIEGAVTSQFENHLRAVAGLPLGATDARGAAAMINFVGQVPERRELLAVAGAHLHLYGKRPAHGRKLGHATLCAVSSALLEQGVRTVLQLTQYREKESALD
ncbi:5-(carboxyamino)imidazole ribonucleotide synthase [Haliea sp. E1-2-M8]|uniref:5-(carboxyamino)imidazole ribonucleotide synthase n=1 Tax=Haliea sp. E1-2-M8 TaxID=3064706 RepID=UPI0027239CDB|nr:5-(carboxyamino)imidazole ribonucleotide synthase [Haliea sp. E1-2-M8]MDO8861743.1 5-(carboxyamino)imidazole ribonucleotide synthase [Haliea sp. E1-2-M8]